MSRFPIAGSFAHDGMSPHLSMANSRLPVALAERTARTDWEGAMLYRGDKENATGAPNSFERTASGSNRVYRPHMADDYLYPIIMQGGGL